MRPMRKASVERELTGVGVGVGGDDEIPPPFRFPPCQIGFHPFDPVVQSGVGCALSGGRKCGRGDVGCGDAPSVFGEPECFGPDPASRVEHAPDGQWRGLGGRYGLTGRLWSRPALAGAQWFCQ